ncbi:hypothetical protein DRQ17_01850, partial [bacterium]
MFKEKFNMFFCFLFMVGILIFGLPVSVSADINSPMDFVTGSKGYDSLNVSFVGNWPFGYSYAVSYDSIRSLIYLGSGGGVYILTPNYNNPIKISEGIHTRGMVQGLFYKSSEQRLYIASGDAGFMIWDVSSISLPVEVGQLVTPGRAYGLYVSDSFAYVAAEDSGLRIIDVSDPTSPSEVGYYDTPGSAYDVYVSGDYAYVADGQSGLRIIDVSDPTSPSEVGYYNTPDLAYDVYVRGNYAYVAAEDSGLRIIDISDPTSPSEVGYCDTPGWAYSVDVKGGCAYVADIISVLRIIDVSDPTS